jgi:serine phosphatase RsbU (regulator of sigma subunit)
VPVNEDSILGKTAPYTDEIKLSYKERVFSFEFAALHFASPEKNQYAYKMEGFDSDWIWSGSRRFVSYTNLASGRYVFRVKASNNDGLWNEKGASVKITVTPRPWKTWWAYTVYVITVISALFGYVRRKTKAQAAEIERHREELEQKRELAELLENTVKERTSELKDALEEITDSLNYARLIQRTLLPNSEDLKRAMPNSFFIWMPRDIVGGDIFFFDAFAGGFVIAVIDCTGHGVPGAFMTMIAFSALKRIIADEKCNDPAEILKRLNRIVKTSLQQDTEYALTDDGLDAAICVVKMNPGYSVSFELTFAGSRVPLFYTQKNEIRVIKGDRQSIGYKRSDLNFEYVNHSIAIQKGMNFYMATDGFTDQLASDASGKISRFGKRRFTELLRKNSHLPFEEQEERILSNFRAHQGEMDRQDDVTVAGFGFR